MTHFTPYANFPKHFRRPAAFGRRIGGIILRIVSGVAKGKILASFTGRQIRPTSDRVRESVFNILFSHLGPCTGKTVLDLYAGTGAMAIEALSRGARKAVLVDSGQQAARLIPANLRACRVEEKAAFFHNDVLIALPRLTPECFDLIFIDPPYGQGLTECTIQAISNLELLAENGILCAETAREEAIPERTGALQRWQMRRYGSTALHFFIHSSLEVEVMKRHHVAVYPGSFDPITYGHLDIIHRGLEVFDELIIAVARNSEKKALFSTEQRLEMIRLAVGNTPRLRVDTFDGLLVDYVVRQGARVILRGLRAVSDFEYEFQIAQMNHTVQEQVETLFMMTAVPYGYLSSSIVKEVASLQGPVDAFVPPVVRLALEEKFGRCKEES